LPGSEPTSPSCVTPATPQRQSICVTCVAGRLIFPLDALHSVLSVYSSCSLATRQRLCSGMFSSWYL
jgi:hypothetical protein